MLKPPTASLMSAGSVDSRFTTCATAASKPSSSSGESSERSTTSNHAVDGKPPNKLMGLEGAVGQIHLIFGRGRVSKICDQLPPLSPRPCSQTIVAWCLPFGLTTYVLPNS
uniref:Uncharacterized protein n=1 Tax=Opuntia streptacantha TaxID=393608 RepID=A0A7C8YVZ6_OPUST